MLQTAGYGAWTVTGIGVLFLVRLTGRRPGGVHRLAGGAGLFWVLICALSILLPMTGAADFPSGGMIGLVCAETLLALVGESGAWITLAGVLAISLTLGLDVHWQRFFGGAARGVGDRVPGVASSGARFTRRAASGVGDFGAAVLERFKPSYDDDRYTDGEWTDATGDWDDSTGQWAEGTGVVHSASRASEAPSHLSAPPSVMVEEVSSSIPPARQRLRRGSKAARGSTRQGASASRRASASGPEADRSPRLPALPISIHEPELGPLPRPTLRPPDVGEVDNGTVSPTRVAERDLVEVEWEATAAPIERASAASLYTRPDVPQASFEKPAPSSPQPVRPSLEDGDWNLPVLERKPTPRPSLPDAFHDPRADIDELDMGRPTRPSLAPPPAPIVHLRPQHAPTPISASGASAPVSVEPGALESGGEDHGGILIDSPEETAFELPHLGLLDRHERSVAQFDEIALRALADKLTLKLEDFGVKGEVTAIRPGPVLTTFEYLPSAGIKLSKITSLEDDIAMALCALRVRIVAPIPGKGVVGFEVPNLKRLTVWIRDILASETFRGKERALPMALGKNVEGKPLVGDLAKAPHLLVAGTTGSGKSVGVNAMLMSMLYTRTPEELRLILIDPKMLEFELYQDIPHLLHPVVTDPALASAALKWACDEMDRRYKTLARWKTRNIASYNKQVQAALANWTPEVARKHAPRNWPSHEPPPPPRPLPYIVVVIDELADLMMVAAKDVEVSIARLAQKARAAGIHLIVATQRPEKTVVTGIIKANLPSRIAFQVRSKLDGRIILDTSGAEALLGKGDMLYLPPASSELIRCQSPFVEDDEVRRVTDHLRSQGTPVYEAEIKLDESTGEEADVEYDELYDLAVAHVVDQGKASTSMIQRQFKIGYNRAARMVEVMEMEGVIGAADGARPRKVLVGAH
jgi:S-DNA-T family DNA segregation ATPase FtsK/SpoIIIE